MDYFAADAYAHAVSSADMLLLTRASACYISGYCFRYVIAASVVDIETHVDIDHASARCLI